MSSLQVIAEHWFKEQVVDVLFKNVRGAILGSSINIALVSFVLWTVFPGYGLLSWFLVGQLLNLIRLYVSIIYTRDIQRLSITSWLNIHRGLTCLSGALYGILAFFFFSSDHPLHQILVILLSGGMGAAAVGTHSVDRVTYQGFLFPAVVPLIIRSYLEGTEVHFVVSAMLCLLMLIMLRAANQSRQIMIDNIYMSQSLRYRATHDSLVEMLNREEFQKQYTYINEQNAGTGDLLSMIFIDLDYFKTVNDTYGHQTGDETLIKISEIIRQSLSEKDIAARFGGDEFMVFCRSSSTEHANKVAENILMRITHFQKTRFPDEPEFGASIGIGYSEAQQCPFEVLLKAADKACYQAKNNGKGKICTKHVSN
ncbi:MAG: diguanylate cyclase [Methylotenera sp.]